MLSQSETAIILAHISVNVAQFLKNAVVVVFYLENQRCESRGVRIDIIFRNNIQ